MPRGLPPFDNLVRRDSELSNDYKYRKPELWICYDTSGCTGGPEREEAKR